MNKWRTIDTAPKSGRFIGARNFLPDGMPAEVWAVEPRSFRKGSREVVEYYAGKMRVFPKVWVEMPSNYIAT